MIPEFQPKLFQDLRSWLLQESRCPSLGWQQLPQLPEVTPCLCFSLPPLSQNAAETRNQIPQLLPGEGDRPLPQAGTYSSRNGNIPREQPSPLPPPPSPLNALLAWIPSSLDSFSKQEQQDEGWDLSL